MTPDQLLSELVIMRVVDSHDCLVPFIWLTMENSKLQGKVSIPLEFTIKGFNVREANVTGHTLCAYHNWDRALRTLSTHNGKPILIPLVKLVTYPSGEFVQTPFAGGILRCFIPNDIPD